MASTFLQWIFLFFLYAHLTNGEGNIIIGGQPATNLFVATAMEGYDPIISDPHGSPDPGIRSQIFEPFTGGSSVPGLADLNSFVAKAREDVHCDASLTKNTYRNYNQYKKEKFSSQSYSASADGVVGIPDFSFDASAGYGKKSSESETSVIKFFRENNGEIVELKSKCITHTVNINPFVKPVFTPSFLIELRELNTAAKQPTSARSKTSFTRFVNLYGTHFMKSTSIGAKLIYKKLFLSTSTDTKSKDTRNKCVEDSAYGSLGGKNKVLAAVSSSFEYESSKCSDLSTSNAYFQQNGIKSASVISIGSLPSTTLSGWVATVRESGVPITFELDKISNMFISNWFNTILVTDDNNSKETLDGTAMHKFFEDMSAAYCEIILGKDCKGEEKGCGISSDCGPGTTCVEVPSSKLGYRCEIKYGGAIIAGGHDGEDRLSSVEAIDTWTLPALPTVMFGGTISVVGKMVYACGGLTNQGTTTECYYFDRTIISNSWTRLANDIPTKMVYHSSSVVGSHVWLVYRDKLYDLDPATQRWRTYSLPFGVYEHHSAVSNGTHTYIIGVGRGQREIWVNTEASNAVKWHKVADLEERRSYGACLWLQNKVYIAGGHSPNYRNEVAVFDTTTHTVKNTGSLNHARTAHGMMVLNGQPAVLGGATPTGSALNSIETYDVATERWTTSNRKMEKRRKYFGIGQLREDD